MKVTDEQIINAVQQTSTLADAARMLGVHLSSLVNRTKRLGIHNPNQGRRGTQRPVDEHGNRRIPLVEILDGKHPQYGTNLLKQRMIREGVIEDCCELCGDQSKDHSRILDHINGVRNDHRRSNLRLLCPLCNAQQPTHAGRNKNKRVKVLSEEVIIVKMLSGKTNREILLENGMVANGANYRRMDRIRSIVELTLKHAQLGESVDPEGSNPSA